MAENPSKELQESLVKHIYDLEEEGIKHFCKEETSLEKFLDEWKPSENLPSRKNFGWFQISNEHRKRTESDSSEDEGDDDYDDDDDDVIIVIVNDEEEEMRCREKTLQQNVKFVRPDEVQKMPFYTRISLLFETWCMIQSKKTVPVTYNLIRQLGIDFSIGSGKWCIVVKSYFIDEVWAKICRAIHEGIFPECCSHANVATLDMSTGNHVICVHNNNWLNQDDVISVERTIRSLGIKEALLYKPGINTYLNIYRGNPYNIRPSVYRSYWQPRLGCSLIFSPFKWNNLSCAIRPDPNLLNE